MTQLGTGRGSSDKLAAKYMQSRYCKNDYWLHNRHEGMPPYRTLAYAARFLNHLPSGNKAAITAGEMLDSAFRQNSDNTPPST